MMNIVEERQQRAAENILGNEQLTADLEDTAAKVLLDWGLDWAAAAVAGTVDMEEDQAQAYLGPRLKALRRMLRRVDLWIRDQDESTSEEKTEGLEKIYQQAQLTQGYLAESFAPAYFINQALQLKGDESDLIAGLRLLLDEEQE